MLTKSRVVQLIFMLTVLLALFFWKTFQKQENVAVIEDKAVSALVNELRCDYLEPCEFITKQGTFYLSINNLPIKPEDWINFELQSPNEHTQINKANIVSKSMFMGRIPVKFKRAQDKLFVGKSLVGACVTDEMIWELQISLESGELLIFDFMVKK